jgi:DNA-binding transcriptional LysR family regulator
LKRSGVPRHPRELGQHNCLRYGDQTKWSFIDGDRTLQVAVKGDFACNLTMPVVAACVAGRGFGRFLGYQVAAELRAKALRIVLSEFELPQKSVSIVYPSARLLPRRIRAFVDWLKHGLKEMAPELVASGA